MSLRQLRERLDARGIRVGEFAEAAGVLAPDLSALFHGRQYLGPRRRARIEAAITALGLDKDPEPDPAEPVVRVRLVS